MRGARRPKRLTMLLSSNATRSVVMFHNQQPLAHVDDARRGDATARAAVTAELRPHLERVVRRVLRRGPGGSELENRIYQVAQSLRDPGDESADHDLVNHLYLGVIARLCGHAQCARPYDTRACDTLCC